MAREFKAPGFRGLAFSVCLQITDLLVKSLAFLSPKYCSNANPTTAIAWRITRLVPTPDGDTAGFAMNNALPALQRPFKPMINHARASGARSYDAANATRQHQGTSITPTTNKYSLGMARILDNVRDARTSAAAVGADAAKSSSNTRRRS